VYLWHWPIVVWLAPHWQSHYRLRQALEVVLTLSIAAASFHLLELPIRQGRVPLIGRSSSRLAFVLVAGVAAAAFAAVSATTLRSDLAREVLDTSETPCPSGSPSAGDFFQGSSRQSADWCLRIAPPRSTSPVVATAGDSTSRALDPGMMRVAQARGWGYIEAGLDGCTVLRRAIQPHLDPVATRQARSCAAVYPRVIAQVTARYHPDVWIVADLTGNDPNDGTHPSRSRINALRHSIRDSIAELTADGAEVVVIRPEPVGEPPDCVLKHPPPSACSSQEFSINYPLTRFMDNTLRSILPSFGSKVSYVSIDDILCPTGRCPATIDGYIARFDSVHFTSQFSRKIVPTIILRAENAGTRFVRTHR
jgi:hypothetical protein